MYDCSSCSSTCGSYPVVSCSSSPRCVAQVQVLPNLEKTNYYKFANMPGQCVDWSCTLRLWCDQHRWNLELMRYRHHKLSVKWWSSPFILNLRYGLCRGKTEQFRWKFPGKTLSQYRRPANVSNMQEVKFCCSAESCLIKQTLWEKYHITNWQHKDIHYLHYPLSCNWKNIVAFKNKKFLTNI